MDRFTKPIDKLLDCQHVKRWTLIATTAQSTVASHSFNVAMIAMDIWRRMYVKHGTIQDVCFFALIHDVDESETGDIPTPTKTAMRNNDVDPNGLFLTQGLCPEPPDEIRKIVKLADLIDNYTFVAEHGAGGRGRGAVAEVHGRLARAIGGASPDLRRAANDTLSYILSRASDTDEERKRIAEDGERYRQVTEFASVVDFVGGEPRHKRGDT